MTGLDKQFDYSIPENLLDLAVGDRVRVDLNGRRVGGWVVSIGASAADGVERATLRPIVARSGRSVSPEVVELCAWVAATWRGPLRAVLAAASAPKAHVTVANPRRGSATGSPTEVTSALAESIRASGGGLLRVPPAASALSVVSAVAHHGPVLVICPTQRMASLGAAALRRKGYGVASLPDEWDVACAGADIVIGARSTVFAPCPELATIVVIDEHDEALKEERSPAWDAVAVARERGRRCGAPVLATSPIPSAEEHRRAGGPGDRLTVENGWPSIVVEDLRDAQVSGTLLGSALLAAARDTTRVTLAILNTKGRAKLIACRSCGDVQRCPTCRSLLGARSGDVNNPEGLWCSRCAEERGSVCVGCGRTSFRELKTGTTGLCSQIERSVGVSPVEVTSETSLDALRGGLFVGTEALLRRVDHADTVVLCDVDRDLGAPRITATREVLADIARAARVAGAHGTVIIQTRDPDHPLLRALGADDVDAALSQWLVEDLAVRAALGMPPYSTIIRVSADRALSLSDIPLVSPSRDADSSVEWSVLGDSLLLRSASQEAIDNALRDLAMKTGLKLHLHVDPRRY